MPAGNQPDATHRARQLQRFVRRRAHGSRRRLDHEVCRLLLGEGQAKRVGARRVGSYPANPWGIADMHGNVWEWCRDWYHARLPGGVDPDLHDVPGERNRDDTYSRVRRGGAWIEEGWTCRSACRLRYEPPRRSDHIGFRVVAVEVESA